MATSITLTALFIILSISYASACHKNDRMALLAIKSSFSTDSFPSWTAATDCCNWPYVNCGPDGRISNLDINGNDNLSGIIPPYIGDFPTLQTLGLTLLPGLVGPIPPQITRLKNLRNLDIMFTSLSGPIPSFLSKFPNLNSLTISGNKFSGTIPTSLTLPSKLGSIDLSTNELTGAIPTGLFQHNSGFGLDINLSNNKLTGEIPPTFGAGGHVSRVDFSGNRLTGDASFLFGVTTLILRKNRLSFNLTNAVYPNTVDYLLDISHNEIYGSLTEKITAPTFSLLDVSYNKLCGKIPSKLSSWNSKFFVHNTCLCGAPLALCK